MYSPMIARTARRSPRTPLFSTSASVRRQGLNRMWYPTMPIRRACRAAATSSATPSRRSDSGFSMNTSQPPRDARHGGLGVEARGVADKRDVGTLREGRLKIREHADPEIALDVPPGVLLEGRRDHLCAAAHAVGHEIDAVLQDRPQVPGVPLADAPEPDDQRLHRAPLPAGRPDRCRCSTTKARFVFRQRDLSVGFAPRGLQHVIPRVAEIGEGVEDRRQVRVSLAERHRSAAANAVLDVHAPDPAAVRRPARGAGSYPSEALLPES